MTDHFKNRFKERFGKDLSLKDIHTLELKLKNKRLNFIGRITKDRDVYEVQIKGFTCDVIVGRYTNKFITVYTEKMLYKSYIYNQLTHKSMLCKFKYDTFSCYAGKDRYTKYRIKQSKRGKVHSYD